MKCKDCGFENDENAVYCRQCGVNLKDSDSDDFKDNIGPMNRQIKISDKRGPYSTVKEDSFKMKLLYKQDRNDGRVRIGKTRCITLAVFILFFIYAFFFSIASYNVFVSFLTGLIVGLVFAVPTFVIGFIIGWIIDRIKS